MFHKYDQWGWYTGPVATQEDRTTDVVPENASTTFVEGELHSNFTGYVWIEMAYHAPPTVIPEPEDKRITVLAFRNRFTQAEKIMIDLAGIDNPAATMAVRQQSAAVRVMQADLAVAAWVDLNRADTRAEVQSLETSGLLVAGRAAQILDNPIQDIERLPK